MKTCTKCKIEKDLDLFYRQKPGKHGRSSICKKCKYDRDQLYKKENPEKVAKYYSKYRENNLEKVKLKDRLCRKRARESRPDTIKQQKRKSYEKDKSRVYKRNAKYVKERSQEDPSFRICLALRSRIHSVLKKNKKVGSAVKDLGCTPDELRLYLESLWQPGMSWDNYGTKRGNWQIDHIIPLSSFDLANREELLIACHYTNLQPMWSEDNWKKGNRV
jgi:hypothetical protein